MRRSSVAALLVVLVLILFVIDHSESPPIRASETPTTISAPRDDENAQRSLPLAVPASFAGRQPRTRRAARRAARVYSPDMFESEADAPPAAFRTVGGNLQRRRRHGAGARPPPISSAFNSRACATNHAADTSGHRRLTQQRALRLFFSEVRKGASTSGSRRRRRSARRRASSSARRVRSPSTLYGCTRERLNQKYVKSMARFCRCACAVGGREGGVAQRGIPRRARMPRQRALLRLEMAAPACGCSRRR